MSVTPVAHSIASHWSTSRKHPAAAVFRQDIAEQVQSHLNHGADPDYLRRIAWWMAVEHPGWFDLALAMEMSGAPKPDPTTAPGRPGRCPCRAALTVTA
jgi:hypothetical protein